MKPDPRVIETYQKYIDLLKSAQDFHRLGWIQSEILVVITVAKSLEELRAPLTQIVALVAQDADEHAFAKSIEGRIDSAEVFAEVHAMATQRGGAQ